MSTRAVNDARSTLAAPATLPHIAFVKRSKQNSPSTTSVSDSGTLRAVPVTMETIAVMMALLVAALVVMPAWPYSARWGYYPASACGMVAFATAALVLVGRL